MRRSAHASDLEKIGLNLEEKADLTPPMPGPLHSLAAVGNLKASNIFSSDSAQPDPLTRLADLLQSDLQEVNKLILDRMQSPVALIPELAGYLIGSGGKRLRPLLTLAAARLCDYRGSRHHALATCVEFIHTATLLHDDVADASVIRRGRASANAVWGNEAPVLVGDFLFARAFSLMVGDGSLDVLRILSRASEVIAEGEVMQLMTQGDLATDIAAYEAVIGAKTAALFSAACEVGGVVAGASAEQLQCLRDYGHALGIAFQIVDDVLDYRPAGDTRRGKDVGDDFREGKLTLPVIFALRTADRDEKMFWERTLVQGEQDAGDLEQALIILNGHDSLEQSLIYAQPYVDRAVAALAGWPDLALRQALEDAARFALARAY